MRAHVAVLFIVYLAGDTCNIPIKVQIHVCDKLTLEMAT